MNSQPSARPAVSHPRIRTRLCLLAGLTGPVVAFAAGSPLTLSVGLTPHGDGSSCGSATHISVEVGDVVDLCYTVSNPSTTPLAYSTLQDSIDGRLLEYAPITIPPGGSYVHHRQIVARTSRSYEATWTAQNDLIRYSYDDSQPLDFTDISATGTPLAMDAWGAEREIVLPFAFPFYGGATDRLCVSNQGFIRTQAPFCYSQTTVIYENFRLPIGTWGGEPFLAGNFLMPYWDLLNNIQGGVWWQVQGQAPNRHVIVQWERGHVYWTVGYVATAETQGRIAVQAVLSEDGSIAFQYRKTTFDHTFLGVYEHELDHGRSATIGLNAAPFNGGSATTYVYNDTMPRPAPSSIHWLPGPAPTVLSASTSVTIDVGGPVIAATPVPVVATAPLGASVPEETTLAIANAGNRMLDWQIAEGSAPAGYRPLPTRRATLAEGPTAQAPSAQGALDRASVAAGSGVAEASVIPAACSTAMPGSVVHDDGVAESGLRGNLGPTSTGVDRFTPVAYPAVFTHFCTAFYADTPVSFSYDIVAYDTTGSGGGPGNEIGSLSVSGSAGPGHTWSSVDIASLNLLVTSGSLYLGVRFPENVGGVPLYLSYDMNGTDVTPPPASEGGWFDAGAGTFTMLSSTAIHSQMLRAVAEPAPCTLLGEHVPWLALDTMAGSVAPGAAASTVGVTLDPSGLAEGVHTANVCVSSGFETIRVPVEFAVGDVVPAATLSADPLTFSLTQGEDATATLTLGNTGTPASLLHYAVAETATDCQTASDVTWLDATPRVGRILAGDATAIEVHIDTATLGAGTYTASLCVGTDDPAQAQLTVPVALTVSVVDAVFGNGFDLDPMLPTQVYTSRDAFLAAVRAGYYEEGFTAVPANQLITAPLTYSGGGFAYRIYTQDGAVSGLYCHPGVISHNASSDQIAITFTTPVTAVGGNFWESNIYGDISEGPIWLSLSDGTFVAIGRTLQATTFRGFTSQVPITGLIVQAPNSNPRWAKLDNLIVGHRR